MASRRIFAGISVLKVLTIFSISNFFIIGSYVSAQELSDSVYLFSYSKDNGKSGLRFAWSSDGNEWNSIGGTKDGYDFVKSDFGPWGSHKTMFSPRLKKNAENWTAVWYVSDKKETLAIAETEDLIHWSPQRYRRADSTEGRKALNAESSFTVANVGGKEYKGEIRKVPCSIVTDLMDYVCARQKTDAEHSELMGDDGDRFQNLKSVSMNVRYPMVRPNLEISDKLIGVFFEDISRAADGGLYAELLQNRDFEYKTNERNSKEWSPSYGWRLTDKNGNEIEFPFSSRSPLHANNPTYLHFNSYPQSLLLDNKGFGGISLKGGKEYIFSLYGRIPEKLRGCELEVSLISSDGKKVGSGKIRIKSHHWQRYEAKIRVCENVSKGILRLALPAKSIIDLDMISLFPADTYKGRRNGLRKDLAETISSLKPRFVRFPGGCVAHGDGIDNIYDWKGSIGELYERKPLRNIWGYHQTRGLGYYEYFLFCEDMGAEPLPVIAAGVPCQNSGIPYSGSHDELTSKGQQCGIPLDSMDNYIRDILDLIEYANGPADSKWGSLRAKSGHPDPFNLKYIGIGNEDMITEVFKERFKLINDVLKRLHPEITVVGTVGPFYEGTDYDEGWRFAKEEKVPMVDEHYYVQPGWFIHNRDFYDAYDRKGPKVYLGEYASHLPDRKNNLETALSVALYLTDVERNGDIVAMTSYAPLLAKRGYENWRPDMVFFDNDSIYLTPDFYVQQMYGENAGSEYVYSDLKLSDESMPVKRRIGHSVTIDHVTGDLILKIANLLPVNIKINEALIPLKVKDGEATVTVLKGNPEDVSTKPTCETVMIKSGKLEYEASPYSFSVIRIRSSH